MKQLNSVSLSFRCPKAFNELVPCNSGWYCNGCHKLVHDMRGKTEEEIQSLFAQQGYNLCGLFEADRIRINAPISKWRKWFPAAVLALGFTGLHQTLMAQQLNKADSIALNTTKPVQMKDANEVFGTAEQLTEYPGGIDKFNRYVAANLKPDASCRADKKVFITFNVGKDGRVSHVQIIRGDVSRVMKTQIINIFENSRPWKPGMQNGRAVKQQYTMPISFAEAAQ